MSDILYSGSTTVVSFVFGLIIFAIVTTIVDGVHSWVGKVVMVVPGTLFRWDLSGYSLEGTWWLCSIVQIVFGLSFSLIEYLVPATVSLISHEGAAFTSIAIYAVMLFGSGVAAPGTHSFMQRLWSGIASLIAIPLTFLVVFIAVLACCFLAKG